MRPCRVLTVVVHGPQMAKKVSLWISSLFHPTIHSPSIGPSEVTAMEKAALGVPWMISDQEEPTLVNTSPDLGRRSERKGSLGAAAIVHEQLIKDLE